MGVASASDRSRAARTIQRHARPLVLIVDDGDAQRFLLRLTLRDFSAAADFDVREAKDAYEARDLITECAMTGRPVLVISDVHLPLASGLELLGSLSAHATHAPRRFLLLTASDDPTLEREAYKLGADDFIREGFDPGGIRDRIEGHVERWLAACGLA